MISVVVFKWRKDGYRTKFTSDHVNIHHRMVGRHFAAPHRYICVTDDPKGLNSGIEVRALWSDFAALPNPTWPDGPSCFRRLKVFSKEFAAFAGPRIVCMDLDMVITGDLAPLFQRKEPFLMWKTTHKQIPYCASMFMFDSACFDWLWTAFEPAKVVPLARKLGYRGSDQGYLQMMLEGEIAGWSEKDGVFGFKEHIARVGGSRGNIVLPPRLAAQAAKRVSALPAGARIVMFTGKPDPWDAEAQTRCPWIKDHYR